MKKRLLILALWITLISNAMGQTWEQEFPDVLFRFISSATYQPDNGLLIGAANGMIWQVNNGALDTLCKINGTILPNWVNAMAFSGDSLFFHCSGKGLWKMKVGETADSLVIPGINGAKVNSIVTKGNKRWFAALNGLFYFDGINYSHNNAFNSGIQYLDVNNSDVAFIIQNDSLMSVTNNQYTLITDTISEINCLKVNPVTNELYFSTPTRLYKMVGNEILPVQITTNLINFSSEPSYTIRKFSFSSNEDRIYLIYSHLSKNSTFDQIFYTHYLVTNTNNNEYTVSGCPNQGFPSIDTYLFLLEANNDLILMTQNQIFKTNKTGLLSNEFSNKIVDKGAFRALINSDGMLFWQKSTDINMFEFPKYSRKNTVFSSTLWLAGINQNNDTCVAATRYNQVGYDFWAGPVAQNYDMNYQTKYNRVWKLDRDQINRHISNYQQSGYTMPSDINTWPAHGDIANGEAPYIAPFFDSNNNGIYDSQNGDYPIVLGQQAAYFIFNDTRLPHTETGGSQLGVEVHGMAYVMDSVNTDLKNTLFVKYNMFNRLNNDFANFYLGKFDDLDLGDWTDDYIGCDSTRNTFYVYNGDSIDGTGRYDQYSKAPPVQAVTFLKNDITQFSFFYSNSSIPAMNDPSISKEYYSYLEGFWKDGTSIVYGGNGYGAGTPANFMFTGNPVTAQGWSEVAENNASGDRRGLASTQLSNFNHGTNHCIDIAYVYNRDCDDINSCNQLSNIPNMLPRVDSVQSYYNHNDLGCTMNSNIYNANTIPDFGTCAHASAFANNSQLNYIMSIDSVQLFGITGVTPTNVKTSWRIYQSGNVVTLNDIVFNVQDNVPVVLSLNLMHNPNTHTMNSQTIQYFSGGLVGIKEITEEQITLYPNPAKGNVRINGVENVVKVEMYNMLGQQELSIEKQDKSSSMNLDLSNMKRGVYFVKIIGAKGTGLTKKLVLN